MTRAATPLNRFRPRRHPRSVLPRARSIARDAIATPALPGRDAHGAILVSLPMAALLIAIAMLVGALLWDAVIYLITGSGF